jgi:hypothetical protein
LENGAPIDASGDLDGTPFADAAGLGRVIHDNPRATACIVQRTLEYALGRTATAGERAWWIEHLEHDFAAAGYRFPKLLRSIAMSEEFYRVASTEKENQE